jgi:hypothetical protein
MSVSQPAGSLLIEVAMNMARIEADVAKMKTAIGGGLNGVNESFDRARASSERYLASLERERAALGKTSGAIKQMEIEANALAAAGKGYDDLAQKIRETGVALEREKSQLAAAAAAKERLAQESREAAAAEAQHAASLAASERYLTSLQRERATLGQSSATIQQMEVEANAAAAAAKGHVELAARIRETGAALAQERAQLAASAAEKDRLAQETREAAAAEAQYASSLATLRASVDPAGAAQARLNAQLDLAVAAFQRGDMRAEEYERTLTTLGGRMAGLNAPMGAMNATVGQQRAGTQQLAYNIQDLGVQFGMAAQSSKPFQMTMMALSQQGPQVASAIGLMTGSTKGFIGFMAGPYGAVLMGAVTILGSLGFAYMNAAKSTKQAEFATYGFKDAQGILGSVMDLTTGKINTQSNALVALARAQAVAGRIQAEADAAAAKSRVSDAYTEREWQVGGGMGGGLFVQRRETLSPTNVLAGQLLNGLVNYDDAIKKLETLQRNGDITNDKFLELAQTFSKLGVAKENIAVFEDLGKAIDGDTSAIQGFLNEQDKSTPKVDRHAESLARNVEAAEALIAGLYGLAAAYRESDAAAMKAEITARATEQGIKARAELESFVAREMRKAVAQRLVDAERAARDLQAQADAQLFVNNAVASGVMTSEEAARQMRVEALLRPVLAAEANAEGAAKQKLTAAIARLRGEQARANVEADRARALSDIENGRNDAAMMQRELELLGATNRERAVALAQLEAELRLKAMPGLSEGDQSAYVQAAIARANAQADLNEGTARFNAQLEEQLNILTQIDDQARAAADGFGESFGEAGRAFGDMLTSYTSFAREREEREMWLADQRQYLGADSVQYLKLEARARKEATAAEMDHYGDMLGAAKEFFKEKSTGYKVIQGLEMAYRAFEMASTIRSIAMDAAATSSSVANSTVRATADQAAGASKMFSQLGVWAFPAVAAMIALLASLGVGGGGGGGGYTPPTAEDLQERIGTGTVLGDRNAQSESIQNALDLIASNTNSDLEYSNSAVRHLRDINAGIDKLTGLIGQQFNVNGGIFDTSSFRLGDTGSGGFLGIGAKSTTRELYDQGITMFEQSVAEVLAQGVEAQVYSVIQQVKKSSGFLGIGGGTKTSYQTVTGELPGAIEAQMQAIVGEVSASVITITRGLGLDVAAFVDNVQLPQVQLSFKDMSGAEIQSALEAYFSSVADQIAAVAGDAFDPAGSGVRFDLADLQRAGEGLFETLARVSRTMMTVDSSLRSIGMDPLTVGGSRFIGATAPAADNLVGQFGDLDGFQDAVSKFADAFLSEAERMEPVISAVRGEMDRLGLTGVTTNDAFKALVLGLDVGTNAGQDLFAQLMAVAPAFARVTEYMGSLDAAIDATGKTAEERARIEQRMAERAIQILELEDKADAAKAARREAELLVADELERAQIRRVHQLEDEAAAIKAAADIRAVQIQIMEAEGLAAEAEAAKRSDALAAATDAMRPWLQALYDARDAANAAADAQAKANASRQLDIRLLEAMGKTSEAAQMKMQDFVNSFDAALRPKAQQVWDAEQAAGAPKTAMETQRAMKATLETARALLDTNGGFSDKFAWQKADPAAYQKAFGAYSDAYNAVWTPRDKAPIDIMAGANARAQGVVDRAKEAEERLQAWEERRQAALDRANTLRQAAAEKEIALLELLGRTSEVTTRQRQAELAAADERMRPALTAFHGLEDMVAREADLARQVEESRDTLVKSYERERDAITGFIDTFTDRAADLREAGKSILADRFGGENAFRSAQVDFMTTAALAGTRDAEAMARLPELSQSFLDLAFQQARSQSAFERQAAYAAATLLETAEVADAATDSNRASLEALNKLVEGRVDTSEKLVAVRDAVATLDANLAKQAALQKDIAAEGNKALAVLARVLSNADGDGALIIRTESDTPIDVRITEEV